MKITIDAWDEQYTIQTASDDLSIEEMAELIKKLFYVMGYHHDNIAEVFSNDE